ncbi:MAG: MBL fold metallo-hydrolase [Anaerorhabdus sp.]
MNFFTHEYITDRVIRIIDSMENCFYLVIGEKKACLIDTGDGFGALKEYVQKLTEKEVIVALTHGHLDHVGGCGCFDVAYLNAKDLDLFKSHNNSNFRLVKFKEEVNEYMIKDFNTEFTGEIKELKNGDIIDLGGIRVEFIDVPGHTMGTMIPIILEERIAIFGDACGVGTLLLPEGSTSVKEYLNSLITFKMHEDKYDLVLRNHGTFHSPKELLDNVIECCEDILSGNYEMSPVVTHGVSFFVAKPIGSDGNRLDGKEGNIKFTSKNL